MTLHSGYPLSKLEQLPASLPLDGAMRLDGTLKAMQVALVEPVAYLEDAVIEKAYQQRPV
jgi:hypothetical protein